MTGAEPYACQSLAKITILDETLTTNMAKLSFELTTRGAVETRSSTRVPRIVTSADER